MKTIFFTTIVAAGLLAAKPAHACRYIFDDQGQPLWDCSDDNPHGGCWWDVDHNGNSVWTCSNGVKPRNSAPTELPKFR